MHFFILIFVNDCICVNKSGMNSKFHSVETVIEVIRVSQTWKLSEEHGTSPKLFVLKRWKITRLNLWAVETNPAEPSSTLSTWRLISPLMKLDASWALPVYPVLKAQSQKVCKHLTKRQSTNNKLQFSGCKKPSCPQKPTMSPRILLISLKKGDIKLNESVKNFIRSLISFDKDDELVLKIGGQKFNTKSD